MRRRHQSIIQSLLSHILQLKKERERERERETRKRAKSNGTAASCRQVTRMERPPPPLFERLSVQSTCILQATESCSFSKAPAPRVRQQQTPFLKRRLQPLGLKQTSKPTLYDRKWPETLCFPPRSSSSSFAIAVETDKADS
jgi:hypothetical protein